MRFKPDSAQKIVLVPHYESIRHASSSRLRAPSFLRHPPINSRQKIGKLGDADRHSTIRHRRPDKTASLKPLREQACPLAIVPNDFYQVTAAASEDIEIASVRITFQCLLNQKRQRAESPTHVSMAGRKPNPYVAWDRNHRRSITSRTRARAPASKLASTRIRWPPPTMISINPLRPTAPGHNCGGSSHDDFEFSATGVGPAIRTAAKRGATAVSSPARARRRQVKIRLVAMP